MNNGLQIFLCGVVIGVVSLVGLLKLIPTSGHSQYAKAIQECEATLPRDRHCLVVGVPNETEEIH
jgi:hypothetical protein